jgi:hypothetical protein
MKRPAAKVSLGDFKKASRRALQAQFARVAPLVEEKLSQTRK